MDLKTLILEADIDAADKEDLLSQYKYLSTLRELHTPKRPICYDSAYKRNEKVYHHWWCPKCNKSYEMYETNDHICQECGQYIDWREIDEQPDI